MTTSTDGVTRLIAAASAGDGPALERLYSVVYDELRVMARGQLARERAGHTLQPTALVHEAFLKLCGAGVAWGGRAQFFAAAAEAMRRLLVDHARARGRLRRGGDRHRVDLSAAEFASDENSAELVALDDALRRLEECDPRMAAIVKLRFFAGLSVEDTARSLELSPRTVKREWALARAWLYASLCEESAEDD